MREEVNNALTEIGNVLHATLKIELIENVSGDEGKEEGVLLDRKEFSLFCCWDNVCFPKHIAIHRIYEKHLHVVYGDYTVVDGLLMM